MSHITNINYRKFLDEGVINTLTEQHLNSALLNVKGRHVPEGRALLICMYYTGARPNEILNLRANDITKDASYCLIKMPSSKRGLPRTIYLQMSKPLVKELYQYSLGLFETMYLFYHYRSNSPKSYYNKKGELVTTIELSNKLRYYMTKWFMGVMDISPYYLRHNRFSKLSEAGASAEEIRILKGGKTMSSVTPYLHMSTRAAKSIAKKMD